MNKFININKKMN